MMSERNPQEPEATPGHSAGESGKSADESGRWDSPTRPASSRDFPYRLLGSGMEIASYTLILGAGGYWIDGHWEHSTPYFAITGAFVGFVLGMYRLIALATRQN